MWSLSRSGHKRLRAAVIGLGAMGRNHVRVYDEVLVDVDLIAVADPDPEALDRATAGRAVRAYGDAAALFAAERPDLVSVVAPTSLHCEITLDALAAGANVLVEKPIATTGADAEAMIAAAANAGRLMMVGHIERFNPAIRELRRRLVAGELGRIFQIKATRIGPSPAGARDAGVALDLASHDLDVMRYLLGSNPVRLYAETERYIHTDHEDIFNGVIRFANGTIGILDINWLTPTKRRMLAVTGQGGMYEANYITQDLVFYANPARNVSRGRGMGGPDLPITQVSEGGVVRRSIRRQEPLTVELSEFARAVREGGPPPVKPEDGLIALLLAQRMVHAASTRTVLDAGLADAQA